MACGRWDGPRPGARRGQLPVGGPIPQPAGCHGTGRAKVVPGVIHAQPAGGHRPGVPQVIPGATQILPARAHRARRVEVVPAAVDGMPARHPRTGLDVLPRLALVHPTVTRLGEGRRLSHCQDACDARCHESHKSQDAPHALPLRERERAPATQGGPAPCPTCWHPSRHRTGQAPIPERPRVAIP